ncbi:hypothetical protein Tco_1555763 [Tanacetum coccineum]
MEGGSRYMAMQMEHYLSTMDNLLNNDLARNLAVEMEKDRLRISLLMAISHGNLFEEESQSCTAGNRSVDDNSTEHSTCQSNDNEGSCGNTSDHSSESESESIRKDIKVKKSKNEQKPTRNGKDKYKRKDMRKDIKAGSARHKRKVKKVKKRTKV